MKKYLILIILLVFLLIGYLMTQRNKEQVEFDLKNNKLINIIEPKTEEKPDLPLGTNPEKEWALPLDDINQNLIVKKFGMYITPQTSPIQPERFTGYHTGVDFEVDENKLNEDLSVYAICSGNLLKKQWANGYGGMIVQACSFNNQPITIVYGHLNLESISYIVGQEIVKGNQIGLLGQHKSQQTDHERKHLHLSIHEGSQINTKGYVGTQAELDNWLDPCLYVCGNN